MKIPCIPKTILSAVIASAFFTPDLFSLKENITSAATLPRTQTQPLFKYTLRKYLTQADIQRTGELEQELNRFFQYVQNLRTGRPLGLIKLDSDKVINFNRAISKLRDLVDSKVEITLSNKNLFSGLNFTSHASDEDGDYFQSIDFNRCVIRGPNGSGVNFDGSVLIGSDFSHSDVQGATFRGAIMDGNFTYADLRNTNLHLADCRKLKMQDVNLEGARLEGANLSGAELNGTNLTNTNLESAILENALYYSSTRFPAGFKPEEHIRRRFD